MRAKVKSVSSPGITDLSRYRPKDEAYCILIEFTVGPIDGPGEEIFAIQVATPLWFTDVLKSTDLLLGRHFLIVLKFNFELIVEKISTLIGSFEADTWGEVALKISRFARWEFEDYQEQ